MSEDKILSCPFCKEEGALTEDDNGDVYVYCIECMARGAWFFWREEDAKKLAVRAWNKRYIVNE